METIIKIWAQLFASRRQIIGVTALACVALAILMTSQVLFPGTLVHEWRNTETIGYIAAILMGLTLGSIGGGGSILTVPILVYLMGVSPSTATAYSLLIVGSTAAYGAFQYYRQGLINLKSSAAFALPSIVAVYLTRAFLMPAIPEHLILGSYTFRKDLCIMVLFGILMIMSAAMMLRHSKKITPPKNGEHHIALVIIEGTVVGVLTGILGAGGGFLIIPALVLLMGMPMKEAVGASLFIIALKSLIGFTGDLQSGVDLKFPLLPIMIVCTVGGMWAATLISHRFEGKKLQRFFAYFTLFVALIIFYKELT